jgi:hypothetical protein
MRVPTICFIRFHGIKFIASSLHLLQSNIMQKDGPRLTFNAFSNEYYAKYSIINCLLYAQHNTALHKSISNYYHY